MMPARSESTPPGGDAMGMAMRTCRPAGDHKVRSLKPSPPRRFFSQLSFTPAVIHFLPALISAGALQVLFHVHHNTGVDTKRMIIA
jgi:hypothetical protein